MLTALTHRRPSRPSARRRSRFQPRMELLEERALLSGVPARFASAAELEQFLVDEAVRRWDFLLGTQVSVPPGGGVSIFSEGVFGAGGGSGAIAAGSRSHSQTNVQVQGVDEADIVKTDGQYVYMLHQPVTPIEYCLFSNPPICGGGSPAEHSLVIVNAWPADKLGVVSRTRIEGSAV